MTLHFSSLTKGQLHRDDQVDHQLMHHHSRDHPWKGPKFMHHAHDHSWMRKY